MYNFFVTYIYILLLYIINIIFSFFKYKSFEIWILNTILLALIISLFLSLFVLFINYIFLNKIYKLNKYNIFYLLPIITILFIFLEFNSNIYLTICWVIFYIISLLWYWNYLKNKKK